MRDNQISTRRGVGNSLDQVQLQISHGKPGTVPIKVGPLDLLEPDDLCVEGQGTSNIGDNDGNVVHAANEISHATSRNFRIPVKVRLR